MPQEPRTATVSSAHPIVAPHRLGRERGLAHALVARLEAQIESGAISVGTQLPTESGLMQTFGVSRTVVREAISRLQAAGTVQTRHGIGSFVLAASPSRSSLGTAELVTAADVLAMLELRISLESEAAGMAASRRSMLDLDSMRDALSRFSACIGDVLGGAVGDTAPHDIAFHLAIARATGNRYFVDTMHYLSATLLPRARIDVAKLTQEDAPTYLRRVNREHEAILLAIARQEVDLAKAAMRLHLTHSRERLQRAQAVAST